MDYENLYKDAVSKIKLIIADKKKQGLTNCLIEGDLNEIFPELAKSDDEQIKKSLIAGMQALKEQHKKTFAAIPIDDCIAWLEKQGEQKSADKVEPKFKVGDWIVHDMSDGRVTPPVQIVGVTTKSYVFDDSQCFYFEDAEDTYRKWTIQDAKDGDVLATEYFIFIFKNIDKDNDVHYYCHYKIYKHENDNQFDIALPQSLMGEVGNSYYSPATKEQRDLLFSKMKEAGYEWDANKKELKKIEQIDEKHKVGEYFTGLIPCWINAPSTLQPAHNYHGKNIIAIHLKDGGYRCCCIDDKEAVTFSLPENTSLVEGWKRKSVEWSDEDEKIIETMCKEGDLKPSQRIWLKSLKDRVQPHWKPTEEQMNALKQTSENDYVMYNTTLKSLYNDLKKL